jgi:zinc/manganese transport system permease protein
MFAGFMVDAWIVATMVAVIGGAVGFFVVLRGSAFPAHAIPNGAFAGAAAATLIGASTLLGLGIFSALAALGIGVLGRRGRHDVATALGLVVMLALGALFLSQTTEYEPEIFSLLFGEILGVQTNEVLPVAILGLVCILALCVVSRPLTLSAVLPDVSEAKGVNRTRIEIVFLLVLALATAMTVPVVGALLIFSLMIGPPAAASAVTARPQLAIAMSVALALLTVWASIALSFESDWPIGFFVGTFSAGLYALARFWAAWRRRLSSTDVPRVFHEAISK